jgi:succinate dehydrogenase flavoprotein subunit
VARRNWEKDPLECAVSWHMTYGGIKIDSSTMMTNVPNLFAAGGVTGHHHIVRVCYDGKVAGTNAATLAKGPMNETPAVAEQLTAEEARIKALVRLGSQVTPPKVKAAIREVMFTKMGPVKTEAGMLEALKELRGIRAELVPQMSLESDSLNWNYELVDALDVFDMVDVCELTVQASLMRKESRGPFYRDDFPFNDNKNFLKNIVVKRVSDGPEFHFEPIDSTIVPKEDKVDYFASDY